MPLATAYRVFASTYSDFMPHHAQTRQIMLDTETTGINPQDGHRIIEIGCVEMIQRRLTGKTFHVYLNPGRDIDPGAIAIHGISNEFLHDKPLFKDIAEDFLRFVKDAELIIHNAPFDVGFLDHELALLAEPLRMADVCDVFDTLAFARKKHPGQRNSLDALCKRYNVDNSPRDLHGALLDAQILANVYLLMTGGQFSLLDEHSASPSKTTAERGKPQAKQRPALKIIQCNGEQLTEHEQRLQAIAKEAGRCLWLE